MATVSESAVALGLDSRLFELIILPTEKCNFRCTYCYEDFAIGKMRPQTVEAIKRLITGRSKQISYLTLSWFGGEPLLAKDVICEIASHAQDEGEANGFICSGGLTTNGYLLTPEMAYRLHAFNHRTFQITLDGDDSAHNRTRVLANGRPTFERIWSNLLMIRDLDINLDVMLRVHVSRSNISAVPRLLEKIDRDLSSSNKFRVHFHRISDLGGPGGASVNELGWAEYGRAVEEFSIGMKMDSSSEYGLAEEGSICYAAKPNSLMIRADGRVGKCTVALDDPRNHVGNLNDDGTIEFFNERIRLWFEGYRDMDAAILGCPLPSLAPDPMTKLTPRQIASELVAC